MLFSPLSFKICLNKEEFKKIIAQQLLTKTVQKLAKYKTLISTKLLVLTLTNFFANINFIWCIKICFISKHQSLLAFIQTQHLKEKWISTEHHFQYLYLIYHHFIVASIINQLFYITKNEDFFSFFLPQLTKKHVRVNLEDLVCKGLINQN